MTAAELSVAQRVALALIRAYKSLFRRCLPGSCRFLPSCSDYAAEAIARHGVVRGSCWRCDASRAAIRSAPRPGPGARRRAEISDNQHFMEKRVLLAVVLSFVVLYGYQALFRRRSRSRRPGPRHAAAPPARGARQPDPAAARRRQPRRERSACAGRGATRRRQRRAGHHVRERVESRRLHDARRARSRAGA